MTPPPSSGEDIKVDPADLDKDAARWGEIIGDAGVLLNCFESLSGAIGSWGLWHACKGSFENTCQVFADHMQDARTEMGKIQQGLTQSAEKYRQAEAENAGTAGKVGK